MKLLPLSHNITVGKSVFAALPRLVVAIFLAVGTILVFSAACASPERSLPSSIETLPEGALSESSQDLDAGADSANQSVADGTEATSSGRSNFEQLSEDASSQILAAIATELNQPASTLSVEDASPELWPDGCLGLASEGEFCTMALIDGWHIQVSSGDDTIIYRSNLDGTVVRREP